MAIKPRSRSQDMVEPEKSEELRPQQSCDQSTGDLETASSFRDLWCKATDDNYLTLYGFRRFRTTHLLNLRYLEKEIDALDHHIFQAGLRLGDRPSSVDKLGLRHGKIDAQALGMEEVMTRETVLKMRDLTKQYGTWSSNNRQGSLADRLHP